MVSALKSTNGRYFVSRNCLSLRNIEHRILSAQHGPSWWINDAKITSVPMEGGPYQVWMPAIHCRVCKIAKRSRKHMKTVKLAVTKLVLSFWPTLWTCSQVSTYIILLLLNNNNRCLQSLFLTYFKETLTQQLLGWHVIIFQLISIPTTFENTTLWWDKNMAQVKLPVYI